MALPLLPGNSFNRNLGKEKYHKSHLFDNLNKMRFMFGTHKPGIGGDPLPGGRWEAPYSRYPTGEGNTMPAWVTFDKQVLSFDSYYQEGVHERREEQSRIRQVKIYFYLEDDSIQVIEPRIRNSGLPQGTVVRRHRIAKPPPNDNHYYTVHDFNVGIELNFYDRVYRIVSCDEFTHNFLRKLGVRVGLPEAVPQDNYSTMRKAMEESMQPLRPYERKDTFRQFLDHDRHVLRFFCFWDDSDSLYGDPREMILHYFLADDTIEIREVIPVNCGRDAAPSFLRRQKVPKKVDRMPLPGEITDRPLLNVFGHPQRGGYYTLDSLKMGGKDIEFYSDADLTIGSYLNVYGRKFVLCDCDAFTKEYYQTKYGITEFKPIHYTLSKGKALIKENPPFNGWGTEEDSLGNCNRLIPRPPGRDFVKFLEKDRRGFESHILRFGARIDTDRPIENERRFIISYHLSDDTILVFEPQVRNSGLVAGKFLERLKIKRPGQERFSSKLPEYFQASDLFVGARVVLNSFPFIIDDADEYCYRYMEQNQEQFPLANIDRIMIKLKAKAVDHGEEIRTFFARQDPDHTGTALFEQLRTLITKLMVNDSITDHEIITVARYYADRPVSEMNVVQILGVAQQQLRKFNFEMFERLREALNDVDRNSSGRIPPETLRNVCKTMRLPVPDDLLRAVIQVTGIGEDECVDYSHFVANVNWRQNPVSPASEYTGRVDTDWTGSDELGLNGRQVEKIRYDILLLDLLGDK